MSPWKVTLAAAGVLSDDAAARLAGPASATVQPRGEAGRTEITLDSDAADIREAVTSAFERVEHAAAAAGLDLRLVGAEAASPEERARCHRVVDPLDLVGVVEVREILDVSRQRVHQLAERPDFPEPVCELASGKLWLRPDIEAFERAWVRRPGRPPKS